MYSRHRSPGSGGGGIRSNSMGMGLAANRISPEGSIRGGHGGFHSLEYRNFNRSFGRTTPKSSYPPPHPQPPPPRRGDIFMEAGRLAAEYLVSQGLLPPNMLPGKWQNGSLKNQNQNQIGDFQEFRPQQDRDNLQQLPPEGRTSALARLGNLVPDAVSGRRRFPEEFNPPTGSRNHMRGRRRMGSFSRGHGSDWGGENESSELSWSEKPKFFADTEAEDDFTGSGYHEEQRVGLDVGGGAPNVVSNELPMKSDIVGDSESELENYDVGSKATTSCTMKELPPETDGEFSRGSNDSGILSIETVDVKDGTSNDEREKQDAMNDFSMQQCSVEDDPVNKNGNDLLRLCSFAKIPTKTRSSLACRGSKADPVSITVEVNTCGSALPKGPKAPMEVEFVEGSSSETVTDLTQSSKFIDPGISRPPSVQSMVNIEDLGLAFSVERGKCTRSQSFPDKSSFMQEQESSQGPPGFGKSNSVVKERGEKRAVQHDDMSEGTKKPREWPSSMLIGTDDFFDIHNLRTKQSSSHEERPPKDEVVEVVDQATFVDVALFPKGGSKSSVEFREEKQLFPSSFKICDLNLMETSDMTENHEDDLVLGLPSTLEVKKERSIDVDLSISNNCNGFDVYGRCSTDAKEIVVVDVENYSGKEEKALDTSERKIESVYSSLEGFPNQTESTVDLPDVQDGYGLMISELLGTDISNCSSVPTDIAGLHTEMGLHNGEGILGDDDQIYLSLGEIPISLLAVWEQSTQEYDKPF